MNGNRDALPFDGMADAEVERRMKVCSFHDSNFGFLFLKSSILQTKRHPIIICGSYWHNF